MDWVWELYKGFVFKRLAVAGNNDPNDAEVQSEFVRALGESMVTVLVQEPWQNSVRFRTLARLEWEEAKDLLHDPIEYLLRHFGGGKFKLNFHVGWNFVATHNFKPVGEPKWKNLPDIGNQQP